MKLSTYLIKNSFDTYARRRGFNPAEEIAKRSYTNQLDLVDHFISHLSRHVPKLNEYNLDQPEYMLTMLKHCYRKELKDISNDNSTNDVNHSVKLNTEFENRHDNDDLADFFSTDDNHENDSAETVNNDIEDQTSIGNNAEDPEFTRLFDLLTSMLKDGSAGLDKLKTIQQTKKSNKPANTKLASNFNKLLNQIYKFVSKNVAQYNHCVILKSQHLVTFDGNSSAPHLVITVVKSVERNNNYYYCIENTDTHNIVSIQPISYEDYNELAPWTIEFKPSKFNAQTLNVNFGF